MSWNAFHSHSGPLTAVAGTVDPPTITIGVPLASVVVVASVAVVSPAPEVAALEGSTTTVVPTAEVLSEGPLALALSEVAPPEGATTTVVPTAAEVALDAAVESVEAAVEGVSPPPEGSTTTVVPTADVASVAVVVAAALETALLAAEEAAAESVRTPLPPVTVTIPPVASVETCSQTKRR